ncbi:MAG: hypothetical protein JOY61_05495 [Chloroflexi bacterium]|nr:hypothetical protein [Chloroflexota bacterium]
MPFGQADRFWHGRTFIDLADARTRAERWSRDVAGQRRHGTTSSIRSTFEQHERAHLLAYDGVPFEVPITGQRHATPSSVTPAAARPRHG